MPPVTRSRPLVMLCVLIATGWACGESGGKSDATRACEALCDRAFECAGIDVDEIDDGRLDDLLDDCVDECRDALEDSEEVSAACEEISFDYLDCVTDLSCPRFEAIANSELVDECRAEIDASFVECGEDETFVCANGVEIFAVAACDGDCNCDACDDEDGCPAPMESRAPTSQTASLRALTEGI